jgi:hypothetical protein
MHVHAGHLSGKRKGKKDNGKMVEEKRRWDGSK